MTGAMSDDASLRPTSRPLGDLVDEMATATPGAEVIVFRDERLDYAGLKVRVNEFARAFLAVGIRRGDRVARDPISRPTRACAREAETITPAHSSRTAATGPDYGSAGKRIGGE